MKTMNSSSGPPSCHQSCTRRLTRLVGGRSGTFPIVLPFLGCHRSALNERLQVFCKDFETFWADTAVVGNRIACRPTLNRQIESAIYVEKESTSLRTNMFVVVSTGSACVSLNWIMSHKAM